MSAPATDFDAPPEEINRVGVLAGQVAGDLVGELGTLRTYVYELGGLWLGVASIAFGDLMRTYDDLTTKLTNALTHISTGLQRNAVNYGQTEHSNKQKIAQAVHIS